MLERQCGDPQVVVWDGSAGPLKLNEETSIVFGSFAAGQQHRYSWFREERSEEGLIAKLPISTVEAGFHFRQDDERDLDLITGRELFGESGVALKEVRQPIGIESHPHFHLSQSI
jgi:hypothetical protein